MSEPRALVRAGCQLAENPFWNAAEQAVYWTDIPNGKLYRYGLAEQRHEVIYQGETVGGFVQQHDGSLLLFRTHDIAAFTPGGLARTLHDFADEGSERFNDVIADPEGRVYAGTIGKSDESGGLFLLENSAPPRLLFRGAGCANGMAFSADLRTFYWTDSTHGKIFAFAYERATGALTDRRLFYQAQEGEGTPDGLTIDDEGNIWSARWGGHAVVCHRPDGGVAHKIEFPESNITSAIFGGPMLETLFLTTAHEKEDLAAMATIYAVDGLGHGLPEFRSRLSAPA